MTTHPRRAALALALLGLLAASPHAQTHQGRLAPGDPTLDAGEFYDTYPIEVGAGDWIEADLTSSDFDPYLVLVAPSGANEQNDDHEGSRTRSYLRHRATEGGTWRVLVTSYQAGETGAYRLALDVEGTAIAPTTQPIARDARAHGGTRVEQGALAKGDATLTSGEFKDDFAFEGRAGERVVIELRSAEFDPYLILFLPDGSQLDNDDHEGDRTRSLLDTVLPADGAYRVVATSYQPGETGAYDLTIQAGGARPAVAAGRRTEQGRLADGDATLRSGEFYDRYTFEGGRGRRARLDLTSDEFDTYLIVQPPRGEALQDDDGGGRTGHSRLDLDLAEPGTYEVLVTSYQPGERGAYRLAMDLGETTLTETTPVATPVPRTDAAPRAGADDTSAYPRATRDVTGLTLNETHQGRLEGGDRRLASGEFQDAYSFDGEAGEPVRVELTSGDFDTYLLVTTPSGQQIENDDAEGSTARSVLEFVMPETGRYRVAATSYRAGETGAYLLAISQADAMRPEPPAYDRVYGLFVGVSDYGGRMNDLPLTAADAALARTALERGAGLRASDAVTLTDGRATRAAFRAALRDLAGRMDGDDLFVLFFSGHGGQYVRTGAQAADPDGRDESIELADGEILDDELDALLAELPAARQLIVLDACYSGGFAKDLISRPGRMGLFSSEEDVISAVADKFEAGGFLSRFFADGLAERHADEDGNGAITALELSQYVYERYRGDVRNTGLEAIIARETRPGHQKLVVDRGSIGPFDTLFLLP